MKKHSILVTGGTGYIGSHAVVELLQEGRNVIVLDNLSNSKLNVVDRIKQITDKDFLFINGDIQNKVLLSEIFRNNLISGVMHFAGLKSVAEGEAEPLKYYNSNVLGSLFLIEAMLQAKVWNLIFSSTATVYGDPKAGECFENSEIKPINVYGKNKFIIEEMIRDVHAVNKQLNFGILRYFNPVGAHKSGLIGENPIGTPNNLMPYIAQVALGKLDHLKIWGNDYPTPDGTGRRDYIHIQDLVRGHTKALSKLENESDSFTVNLGTGMSYSVLEVIAAFEKVSGVNIPYQFASRRPGDVAENYANSTLAFDLLGWRAECSLEEMCLSVWHWIKENKV